MFFPIVLGGFTLISFWNLFFMLIEFLHQIKEFSIPSNRRRYWNQLVIIPLLPIQALNVMSCLSKSSRMNLSTVLTYEGSISNICMSTFSFEAIYTELVIWVRINYFLQIGLHLFGNWKIRASNYFYLLHLFFYFFYL